MNRLFIWKYNRITGYWALVRDTTPETQEQWLDMFRADEPAEYFKLAKRRPAGRPR